MKLTRIKFKNMAPLHLGMGRGNLVLVSPVLQSDSISSALASVRAMKGNVDDVKSFLERFTVSSAFPYDGDEYFLPRPIGRLNIKVNGMLEEEYRKKLKALRYVSSALWQSLIDGNQLQVEPGQLQGEFLIAKRDDYSQYTKPMTRVVSHRVQVPRNENRKSEPFMFSWTYFHHGERETGLYCLVDALDDAIREEVIGLFKELGLSGIGTDRTVGGGHFDIAVDEIELSPAPQANATMLLSTFIPDKEDLEQLQFEQASYSVIKRGGFLAGTTYTQTRHLRRQTINMLDVGSVFPTTAVLRGRVEDVTPEWKGIHRVYRSGKPLCITIKTSVT